MAPLLRVLLLTVFLAPSLQQPPWSLHPADLSTLLDIGAALHDLPGSRFFSSWDLSFTDPCFFTGVTCATDDNGDLRVTQLSLGTGLSDSPGLTGTLPASISTLSSLTDLIVYPGRISGSLPPSLPSSLHLISITSNLISGTIPDSLSTLPSLHTLDLSGNRLTGTIPALPASLKTLILASNSLSGALPTNLNTTSLLHLDLRENSFTGEVPPLPATLRFLSISANSLSGELNALVAPPSDLTNLDLSTNYLIGEVPVAIFALPALSTIQLQRNNLSGAITVPDSGGPWDIVDLSHNSLSGELPPALAAAESLYLNSNCFTGVVPAEFSTSVYAGKMSTFYVQHNFFTGFAVQAEPPPETVSVCLSYNWMALPAGGGSGCPADAGALLPRPAGQCAGGGSGG